MGIFAILFFFSVVYQVLIFIKTQTIVTNLQRLYGLQFILRMFIFSILLHDIFAHRMMLTWNCGDVNQGAFVDQIQCSNPTVLSADIKVSKGVVDVIRTLLNRRSVINETLENLQFTIDGEKMFQLP